MSEVIQALNKLKELAGDVQKVAKELVPLCEDADEVRKDGVSLLQVKYATLMRYNYNLTKLLVARVRGEPILPITQKLVEDSVVLSKLRPIERKLQHHIDLLLKGSHQSAGTGANEDRNNESGISHLRPNPSEIVVDEEDEVEGDEGRRSGEGGREPNTGDGNDDVYRPPRLTEVVYDATAERKRERKQKEEERFKERALRSETIREMVAQVKGLPDEVGADGFGDAARTTGKMRQAKREDDDRRRYEERNFTRLNLSVKDKKRRREMMKASESHTLTGESDFKGLSSMADRMITGGKSKKRRKNSRDDDVDDDTKMRKLDEALEG